MISPEVTFARADNVKMGRALLGVIIHRNAKGVALNVVPDVLEKLEHYKWPQPQVMVVH